jgi:hypothetical protein
MCARNAVIDPNKTVHRRRWGGTTRLITIKAKDRKDMFRAIFEGKFFKDELDL